MNFHRSDTLLACASTPQGIAPMTKRGATLLQHCANPHRKLTFAGTAAPKETAIPISGLGIKHLVYVLRFTVNALGASHPPVTLPKLYRSLCIGAGKWKRLDHVAVPSAISILLLFHARSSKFFMEDNANLFLCQAVKSHIEAQNLVLGNNSGNFLTIYPLRPIFSSVIESLRKRRKR